MGGPGSGRRPGGGIKQAYTHSLSEYDRKSVEQIAVGLGMRKSRVKSLPDKDIMAVVKKEIHKRM
jgi:hypothetical protein